jgi:hypothetical protein
MRDFLGERENNSPVVGNDKRLHRFIESMRDLGTIDIPHELSSSSATGVLLLLSGGGRKLMGPPVLLLGCFEGCP